MKFELAVGDRQPWDCSEIPCDIVESLSESMTFSSKTMKTSVPPTWKILVQDEKSKSKMNNPGSGFLWIPEISEEFVRILRDAQDS